MEIAGAAPRVAVLLTVHNRCATTLRCLRSLFRAARPTLAALQAYLVDDGSGDGTADAVKTEFPQVTMLPGDASLYWNGGMRLAFETAMRADHDHYLWLNDDVVLADGGLELLLETYASVLSKAGSDAVIVGSTCDPVTGDCSYGGWRAAPGWIPNERERVEPGTEPRACETMNGNCVLVPRRIAITVGNLDSAFRHNFGDFDYGHRVVLAGFSIWVAPGFIGTCELNRKKAAWHDRSLPGRERWRSLVGVRALPPREWLVYVRRHRSIAWPIVWVAPYAMLLLSILMHWLFARRTGPRAA